VCVCMCVCVYVCACVCVCVCAFVRVCAAHVPRTGERETRLRHHYQKDHQADLDYETQSWSREEWTDPPGPLPHHHFAAPHRLVLSVRTAMYRTHSHNTQHPHAHIHTHTRSHIRRKTDRRKRRTETERETLKQIHNTNVTHVVKE